VEPHSQATREPQWLDRQFEAVLDHLNEQLVALGAGPLWLVLAPGAGEVARTAHGWLAAFKQYRDPSELAPR
jgi:hypothetical protein